MLVYPTIELQSGRCVSLVRGKMDEPQIWHVDPVVAARRFVEEGAERLHVVDLDAAIGAGSNTEIVEEIIRHAEVPVQVAGGVRSMEFVEHWADAGAARIVIGTAAVRSPELVLRAAKTYPDQIVVAVDVWKGKVMAEGWTETTIFDPIDFIRTFADAPLAAFILTDIDRDLDQPESSIALTSKAAAATRTPVISSGLVKTLDDLSTLRYVYNISGVIIGRAFFNRSLVLADVLEIAAARPERIAEFQ